jgi:hypothetical protein
LLNDEVRYTLPVALPGPVRDLLHALHMRPALERIFDYRQQVFVRLFGNTRPVGVQAYHPAPSREENTV